MARNSEEATIRELLRTHPKGLTIEEVSKKLSLNRTTAAKYLNAFVLTGQAEMRMLGSAKLFSLTQRVPLTNLLSLSSDLILILDNDLFIQEVNAPFLAFFGMPKDLLKGAQLGQSPISPHFPAGEMTCIERALDGDGSAHEVQFDLLDDPRYFKMKCIPLTFENGARAVGIILEDITEMKTYQQALEQRVRERTAEVVKARDFAENLISTANAMIIGLDTNGNLTIFNTAAEEVTGYTREKMMGKRCFEVIVPKERFPGVWDEFHHLAAGGTPRNFESPVLTKSGSVRYISWNNNTITEDGKTTATISFGIDITERRHAEEQLKESQRMLATLMGNLPGMAYRCRNDPAWTMEFASEGCADLTGYQSSDLIGNHTTAYADIIHPEDRQRVWDETQEALDANQSFQIMYRIHTSTGTEKWVWVQGLGIHSPKGEIIAIEGFITDITDSKHADEIIRKANKQVALLTSITRHDIINQINSLQGYIAILKKNIGSQENASMLNIINTIAGTILRQIVFTRDYQNVGAEPPQWIPVAPTLEGLLQTIDRGSVEIMVNTGGLEIYADPLIEKVFFNLIDNSLRHGEHVTRITVTYTEDDEGLSIICEDDGIGIPEEEKDRIFSRGFGKNTGYGLFLIREILSITGFTISENGIPDRGARFVIRIAKKSYRFA
ncbi:MAG: PAS domain S-box protein [Methanoregula sp.]|jgi:PAS domain S-box-containing protein|nr:PAS domain S-box protein [Methanoregula sp.]